MASDTHPIFIGRTQPLLIIYKLLQGFLENKHTRFFFHLYALTGMGKSWLTWMLLLALRESQQADTCWISFAPTKRQPPFPTPPPWLAQRLIYRPAQRMTPLYLQTTTVPAQAVAELLLARWQIDPESRLPALQRELEGLEVQVVLPERERAGDPLILFLDGLDNLEFNPELNGAQIWSALQEHLLRPLYFTGEVFCITTGQAPLSWRYFDLARVATDLRLEPFQEQDVAELAYARGFDPLAADLWRATQGHPFLTERLLKKIKEDEIDQSAKIVTSSQTDARAISPPPGQTEPHAALHAKINALPTLAQTILPAASLLRSYDLGALHAGFQILARLDHPAPSMADLRIALQAYLDAELLAITVEGPLRYPWQSTKRLLIQQICAKQIDQTQRQMLHEAYADWYAQELRHDPKRHGFLISEWMYQSLQTLAPTPEAHQHWLEHFRQLWWQMGDHPPTRLLTDDHELQQIGEATGLGSEISRVMQVIPELLKNPDYIDSELRNYLHETRIAHDPEPLEPADFDLLAKLAKQQPFTVAALRALLVPPATSSPETPLPETLPAAQPTPTTSQEQTPKPVLAPLSEAMAVLDKLRAHYLVEFDSERNGFVVDPWFTQRLSRS